MSTMRELSLEEVANQYGGTHRAAKEYNALRARVAELERQLCAQTPPDSILDMAECAAMLAAKAKVGS